VVSCQSKKEEEPFQTTDADLAGFWDLVLLQVTDVDRMFAELDELRQHGWNVNNVRVSTSAASFFLAFYSSRGVGVPYRPPQEPFTPSAERSGADTRRCARSVNAPVTLSRRSLVPLAQPLWILLQEIRFFRVTVGNAQFGRCPTPIEGIETPLPSAVLAGCVVLLLLGRIAVRMYTVSQKRSHL